MFIITGTPFVTKISYDAVAVTKAIAREKVRRGWGYDYTDAGLEEMVRGWKSDLASVDPAARRQQQELRSKVKEKLALFMIRRDENSRIRGEPVMIDYFKECTVYEDSLMPRDGGQEVRQREALYTSRFGKSQSINKTRNDNMRCLCWSYRFTTWRPFKLREGAAFWSDFTLREAEGQIRTRELIKILREGERTGNGVIIFVQRTFQAELCVRASLPYQVQ
jgi:hypothetical protein